MAPSVKKEYPANSKKYEESYSDLLYKLLPAIYQSKDKKEADFALRQFIKIIAAQAALMRRDIDGLWADFFIDTCKPWVVPYIGDLVGTNLVLNEAARNRSDVKRTIFWRRRKGTTFALEDLANFITGWNVKAVELFQLLAWSQNLKSLKFQHFHTPDMRESVALDRIYGARDVTCHNVDLRNPDQSRGWYNIKNIGFFFSRQQIFQIRNGSPIEDVNIPAAIGPGMDPAVLGFRFCFDPSWKPLANVEGTPPPLYEKHSRRPIRKADFAFDPYAYFGSDREMSVMTYNILAANQRQEGIENLSRFAGRAQVEFLRFEKLAADRGIWLLEPRKFADPRRAFEISVIDWNPLNPAPFTELGKLTIISDTIQFTKQLEVLPQDRGYTVIKVKIDNNSEPCIFPQTVIGIRRSDHSRSADSLESRFSDAVYAYLPEFLLAKGEEMYFLIGEDGSTFYTNNNGKFRKGNPQFYPENHGEILRKTENTARRSLGQIFPARLMSSSYQPVNGFLRLNRDHGIRMPDKSRPAGQHFVIVAHSRSRQAQALVPLGGLNTSPGQTYQASDPSTASERQDLANAEEVGVLIISVQPVNDSDPDAVFPMSELILTNRSNQSLLVYLPEIGGDESNSKTRYKWDSDGNINKIKYFFVADDGSSFFCSHEEARNPHIQQMDATDDSLTFSPRNLARKSAGQILPMPGQVPIRFRIPISYDIDDSVKSKKFNPLLGELGIDPVNGVFCFPEADFGPDKPTKSSISVSYNYGFPYAIGAGSFDRTIQASFGKDLCEKKYTQINNMPTFWVSKSLDVADNRADKNTVFGNLKGALDAAKDIQGDVVIQIQDGSLYIEDPIDFHSLSVKGLTIQSANGQRPTVLVKGSGINIQSDLETLTLNGLLILAHDASTASSDIPLAINAPIFTLSGRVKEIHIAYSTINPSLRAIRLDFSVDNNNNDNNTITTFADLTVDKSILGGLDCGKIRANLAINNSVIDCSGVVPVASEEEDDDDDDGGNDDTTIAKQLGYSIVGSRVSCDIDRSTLYGKISIDILNASETIFDGLVMVRNRQEGCVRYSRFRRLSYLFNWTRVRPKDGTRIPDNDKLTEFLVQNFNDLEWVENADIAVDDEDTITLTTSGGGNNSIIMHLNDDKTGASLVVDEKNYQLVAKPPSLDNKIISIFAFSSFPRLYRCTDTVPLFNSRLPWDPHYMQLNVKCEKDVIEGAENKSEMGAYYYGYYSLAANNLRIKLKEYLPLMLKPAAITEE